MANAGEENQLLRFSSPNAGVGEGVQRAAHEGVPELQRARVHIFKAIYRGLRIEN